MFGVHYMPVWIYNLAAYLRPISNLQILMFDIRTTAETLLPEADIFLFTGINQDYPAIMEFLKMTRHRFPNSTCVLGGPICWSYQQAGQVEKLYAFDHLVIGDGEPVIKNLIENLVNGISCPKVLEWSQKFEVATSLEMDRQLLDESVNKYYGAVVEVSRGCPFLCEFCDIRIQKDNNRPHNVSPELIVQELNYFSEKGIKQILFACDNFIGDPVWAESVCDAIISWKEKTGKTVNIYTWLTINVANFNTLLEKLRRAGFDMFFIGIESFEQNQLLETAKIQNVKGSLVESIQKIHSHGFIVVAGLIFGFDTEPENVYTSTLDGIMRSGLISGEPSLLTALPGTPLYKRMKHSGRIRDGKLGLGGYKYQTNIRYLRSRDKMIENFQNFVHHYNKGKFQYERLKNFCNLVNADHLKSMTSGGYINPKELVRMIAGNKKSVLHFSGRLLKLVSRPERLYYLLRSIVMILSHQLEGKNLWKYFNFWIFVWSNSVIKFESLKGEQFDIGSVEADFDYNNLLPKEYLEQMNEPIPDHKMKAQRKLTTDALSKLISGR